MQPTAVPLNEESNDLERSSYLQPIVELDNAEIVGYELLSRWKGKDTLDVFAKARAEKRLPELCGEIIQEGLTLMPRLPRGTFLSINVSVELLASIDIERSRIGEIAPTDRSRLVMEITEQSPGELDTIYEVLNHYRQKGIRCALDDAGSRYGNIYRAVQVLPDFIKIDQSYVRFIDSFPTSRAVVRSLVTLGREIHARVIAEGIETAAEAAWCLRLGVGYGQGYFFARPKPVDEYLDGTQAQ